MSTHKKTPLVNLAHPLVHKRRGADALAIRSFKAENNSKRTFSQKVADGLTDKFGSMTFLVLNVIWFAIWIVINGGITPTIAPFDEYPFSFLTMVVSLEAIILAIIVLISQNRASTLADVREEIELQINVITEREITKILEILSQIAKKQGIDVSQDEELQQMLTAVNVQKIERMVEKEIDTTSKYSRPSRSKKR